MARKARPAPSRQRASPAIAALDAPSEPAENLPLEAREIARLAAGIDPAARSANLVQLRRARGQIDGIQRMIEQDRYCADIIVQITAVRASLQVVAKSLLAAHLKACHQQAMSNGGAAADTMYQELVDLVGKMAR